MDSSILSGHSESDDVLSCHAPSLVAPPPSPLHEAAGQQQNPHQVTMEGGDQRVERTRRTAKSPSQCEALADELSLSLATIAREERRKVQYNRYRRGDSSTRSSFGVDPGRHAGSRAGESDGGGDASEESWLSFLGTHTASGQPPVVTSTNSSGEEPYSSGDRASNDSSADTQQHWRRVTAAVPRISSDGHGLPRPVGDLVQKSHDDTHAAVSASLPPPHFKNGCGVESGSSSVRSAKSDKTQSGDENEAGPLCESKIPHRRFKRRSTDWVAAPVHKLAPKVKKQRVQRFAMDDHNDDDDSSSSSSSSSEGGYDASSSDNRMERSSCSSPSVSSSEDGHATHERKQFISRSHKRKKRANRTPVSSGSPMSDLAAFSDDGSSSFSEPDDVMDTRRSSFVALTHERKRSHDAASLRATPVKIPAVRDPFGSSTMSKMLKATKRRHQVTRGTASTVGSQFFKAPVARLKSDQTLDELEAPIFSLGCDMMAHCMAFLPPTEVHSLMTAPLSKQWRDTFAVPQDVWRILCLTEPFKAKFGPDDIDDSSDDSIGPFPTTDPDVKRVFGRYRLLYTSFIRCLRYLSQIKDDALHGRAAPSVLDYGGGEHAAYQLTSNSGLREFLAKARIAVGNNSQPRSLLAAAARAPNTHVGLSDDDRSVENEPAKKKPKSDPSGSGNGVTYGHSKLTQRLLGPSKSGAPGNVALPWSCAIYSIVNWMVAFSDVEGIQTLCLKVLPFLLENEGQRTTAQNAGLTDVVLRAMVVFPDSVELHTAAFHTIVLLARPLGGREGMLFHSSMVNSSGIFNNGSRNGKSGIAVMLDSMARFEKEDILQAMSCWSLVNIALAPSQKSVLVKLGGIQATINAMMQHPYNAEVQFRALFALINLVIPSVGQPTETNEEERAMQEQLGELNQTVEKEVLDESVAQIANLVVVAMKHFCSSESILNRACLVLHNLSLSPDYHSTLLWTKGCYQMLEWCLANFRTDQVLQQSAAGTLHRLQQTLASNEELRHQFTSFLQSQQQHSLEEAHREAVMLQEQESLLASQRQQEAETEATAQAAMQ